MLLATLRNPLRTIHRRSTVGAVCCSVDCACVETQHVVWRRSEPQEGRRNALASVFRFPLVFFAGQGQRSSFASRLLLRNCAGIYVFRDLDKDNLACLHFHLKFRRFLKCVCKFKICCTSIHCRFPTRAVSNRCPMLTPMIPTPPLQILRPPTRRQRGRFVVGEKQFKHQALKHRHQVSQNCVVVKLCQIRQNGVVKLIPPLKIANRSNPRPSHRRTA